jgi:hypothetical protein
MHETLQENASQLQRQLEWVAERFTLISPDTFFGLWDRTHTPPKWAKPAVLFTFDDGRASNYAVVAPMLGIHGNSWIVFFVVPEFIGANRGGMHVTSTIRGSIYAGARPLTRPNNGTPMNPEQLGRSHSPRDMPSGTTPCLT